MTEYLGVLIYIALAISLGLIILGLSWKVSPRRLDLEKATAYECGFDPFGEARSPFDVGFYLVAILFLVFDIEVAYLFPWALGGVATGWAGWAALLFFLFVLVIGFVYEWQKGALDWNSEKLSKIMDRFMLNRRSFATHAQHQHHPYHLVDPSPWPAMTSLSVLWLAIGLVLYFHKYQAGGVVLSLALMSVVYMASIWWRDVMRESRIGCHTPKVKDGLHLGMILFIVTEAMFFVGLLWAFLHAALMPTVQIGMAWPPVGIVPVDWTRRPTLNTVLLATSYFSANAAKHALDQGDRQRCRISLIITIALGVLFTFYQYLEYTGAAFTFSDSIFGSTFYLSTGFHGFHVIIGFLFLTVCLFTLSDAGPNRCTALDLAVLYWHFVDIVWIGILSLVYIWGGATPTATLETCQDAACVLQLILHDARLDAFYHEPSFFEAAMSA